MKKEFDLKKFELLLKDRILQVEKDLKELQNFGLLLEKFNQGQESALKAVYKDLQKVKMG